MNFSRVVWCSWIIILGLLFVIFSCCSNGNTSTIKSIGKNFLNNFSSFVINFKATSLRNELFHFIHSGKFEFISECINDNFFKVHFTNWTSNSCNSCISLSIFSRGPWNTFFFTFRHLYELWQLIAQVIIRIILIRCHRFYDDKCLNVTFISTVTVWTIFTLNTFICTHKLKVPFDEKPFEWYRKVNFVPMFPDSLIAMFQPQTKLIHAYKHEALMAANESLFIYATCNSIQWFKIQIE